jgi:hypothetical protein
MCDGSGTGCFPTHSSWKNAEEREEGKGMKKFLILLGIIGIIIAVVLALRNRQESLEFDYSQ